MSEQVAMAVCLVRKNMHILQCLTGIYTPLTKAPPASSGFDNGTLVSIFNQDAGISRKKRIYIGGQVKELTIQHGITTCEIH